MAPFATLSRSVCAVAASTRRWAGREQAELERRLIRVLHREPAVVAILRVRVDAESEFFDIELKGFVLISNVQADNPDTLTHGTSVFSAESFISPASCRRFSETALVRFGLWAALRMHAGTGSG